MTIKEKIRQKVLGILGGLSSEENTLADEDRLTFMNDKDKLQKMKVREYNVWYSGESDELLNFYTHSNMLEFCYEPFYDRNKRSYYWSTSATESDIKRTHSGMAKNIVDTIVAITGTPTLRACNIELDESNVVNNHLREIFKENDFWESLYRQAQMPMTLTEGWGCYKIAWDLDISDNPFIMYYKAENVDFVYNKFNRVMGIIFKDFYTNGKDKKYMILEVRRQYHGKLIIEKELYECHGEDLKRIDKDTVSQFKDMEMSLEITNYRGFLAEPCIFYKDTSGDCPGRSILSGKLELLDDLDQCLSQSANAVKRSTPVEYFDSTYLERDPKTKMPVQPKVYDRKFVMIKGQKTAEGTAMSATPVTVTQPNLNFEMYTGQALSILTMIVNGIISPATLGIDVAKKDNADAQREKEKITIFTRNNICACEKAIIENLSNDCLIAWELMHTGRITKTDYEITVTYPDFVNDSFENKIMILGDQLDKGNLSYDMYLKKLYGNTLKDSEYNKELEYLKSKQEAPQEDPFGGMGDPGMMGEQMM